MIHLDSHVLVWLYSGDLDLLSRPALDRIEAEELFVSPIVELELQYLYEIGRLTQAGPVIVEDLVHQLGLRVADAPFSRVVREAGRITWTRDPFDRLIVAQATLDRAPLLTKDRLIRANFGDAVWD